MLIQELVLRNFRIYAGENRFELSPRKRYGKTRPIILFGGLNGAGKTSLLIGLRLALYGRFALGSTLTQKEYEFFLKKSIHKSKTTNRAANEASVELFFTYAKLGVENQYRITRSWKNSGKSVKESLQVFENGGCISGLSYEQAQNFLNELIPIGVSDLFFFDGEKIKELAEDTGGAALESSIKKLMGLDIIERLSSDLIALNRNLIKSSSVREINDEIEKEQSRLSGHRKAIEKYREEISSLLVTRAELHQHQAHIQHRIDERGGQFSLSRKELEKELDRETSRKLELHGEVVMLLADAAPLSLASAFNKRLLGAIQLDLDSRDPFLNKAFIKNIQKNLELQLLEGFKKSDIKKISDAFIRAISDFSSEKPEILHDLTPSQASLIISSINKGVEQAAQAKVIFKLIEKCEARIDALGTALSRAPDDALIHSDFEELQKINVSIASLDYKIEALRDIARKEAEKALACARNLDKLYEKAAQSSDQRRVLGYIGTTNELLEEFVRQAALSKIVDLEVKFIDCFSRLSRKSDMDLRIRIDPITFKFDLVDNDGRKFDKDGLSAGEKQIFAISILEALAKTSGRQLPMIVDTPLGRLDSMHRNKLIEEYFPRVSHQMIILSTDTEVDESFYQMLSPEISRAYKLEYDPAIGATKATEGYFWQKRKGDQ